MDNDEEDFQEDDDSEILNKELFKNIDIYIDHFIDIVKIFIDKYKEYSDEKNKTMMFKSSIPDDHNFDNNELACDPRILNFKYRNVIIQRVGEDLFKLVDLDSIL